MSRISSIRCEPNSLSVPMTEAMPATWVLRWDTDRDEKPTVLHGTESDSTGFAVHGTGSGGFAIFDGYLFDRRELGIRPGDSDALLVAEAYRRWGEELFDKLRGAFTLGVWDDERKQLLVGRDALGLNPCFYWWDGRI